MIKKYLQFINENLDSKLEELISLDTNGEKWVIQMHSGDTYLVCDKVIKPYKDITDCFKQELGTSDSLEDYIFDYDDKNITNTTGREIIDNAENKGYTINRILKL